MITNYYSTTYSNCTQPIFIGTPCKCTWTVCQCISNYQTWLPPITITNDLSSKAVANKLRIEAIPLPKREPRKRVRLIAPKIRPSIQALSMRIR